MSLDISLETETRSVQKLDPLQIVQVGEPVTTVLAAILALCVGPSTRFDCC